jgi:hypothetical protein
LFNLRNYSGNDSHSIGTVDQAINDLCRQCSISQFHGAQPDTLFNFGGDVCSDITSHPVDQAELACRKWCKESLDIDIFSAGRQNEHLGMFL